jgi:hypothetical protein
MKRLLFSFGCALVLAGNLAAQVAMTRSTFTSAYAPISLPSATLSTATGDDVQQSTIPIGFTFNYLGTPYTTIGLNTNGVASFDPVMSASGTNINLFAATGPNNCLAPWWDNLFSDTVLYELQGTPGNQTFTIQWTNSYSYANTATQQLNFQVVLFEGTDVIEFHYGAVIPGVVAANESASIGIENATGGAGNYIDAATGSSLTSNGMLHAVDEWPTTNYRFTPGIPVPVLAGTYTVGISGNYTSLSEAIADVNHRGISGPVLLSLTDANYDVTAAGGDNWFPMLIGPIAGTSGVNTVTITSLNAPAVIASEGSQNGNCGNAAANNVITNTNEPILAVVGGNYIHLKTITLTCSSSGIVDRGLQVINSSSTVGSMNNTFEGITVSMNRANTGCYGISQQAITTPTAASGSNSNNHYYDLTISNVYTGIYLNGNVAFPDANNEIGVTNMMRNTIGGSLPGDIGAGTGNTSTYGIRANNQSDVLITNCEVRNLSHAGTVTCEGIVVDAGVGSNNRIYGNMVHDIAYTGTANTGNLTGIRVNLITTGANNVYVYNNFVWGITSTYSGPATATRAIRGIYVQSTAGGNATSSSNIEFNSVSIDNSTAPNLSSTCIEVGTITGPVVNIRNNVFANFTPSQAGNANHFTIAVANAGSIGNTGSVSDYNDLYIANAANGNIGIGGTSIFASLANWQTAVTQDANSINSDPYFFTAADLHVSAVALNGTATSATSIAIATDIDGQARAVSPDIGADEFAPLLLDAGATALVSPTSSGCHTAAEQVTVTIRNFAAVPLDFTNDAVVVTVDITGAVTQSLNFTINNNALNGNVPLASGAAMDVPVGTFNMTSSGTYTFNAYTGLAGDGNILNDSMSTVNISFSAGTVSVSSASVCAGSSVNLILSGASLGTIQWQSSTDGGTTWNNETGTGYDSTFYVAMPGVPTIYQVLFCGATITNTVIVTPVATSAATVVNDTVCGPGVVNLNASGSGTIFWYADSTGNSFLTSGTSFSPTVNADSTFYISNSVGSNTQGVGLLDNTAGGAMSGSVNNLIFDVYIPSTLTGVYIYPAAVGTVTIDLEDNTNAVLNSATYTVVAGDIGQRTYVPLNFTLTPGTGMQLVRNGTSVLCWRNNVGVNFPYTIPGVLSITTSTAGAGFYYYFYDWQIAYGCEGPRVPLSVTVLAPPAITVGAASSVLCAGDSTAITVSSSNGGYSFVWTPAGTLSSTTGSTVTATPSSTLTYTVNADDASTGCRAIDSVTITVNALPFVVVSSADSVICTGVNDTLTAGNVQSVGLFDNSAGGAMSGSANNLIFDVLSNCTLAGVYIYPAAAGNVIIELQDNTNAVINTFTYVATAADVNNRTYVALNFPLSPATGMQLVRNAASVQCWRNNVGVAYPYTLPGVLDITTSTAGAGFYYFFYDWQIRTSAAYSYAWTSNPVGFTATGDSAFVAPTVSTQYFVTVTDSVTGCSAQFSTSINIALPVDATVTGPASICGGDSGVVVAGFTGGDGTVSYVWGASLGTNDSITVTPVVSTTYTVTATDGCGSTSVDSFLLVVTSGPPTAMFSETPIAVNIFAFTDASTAATSWQWDFGDAVGTSTQQNPTYTYAASGTYTVTLIVTNGCGTDTITQVVVADGIENHISEVGYVLYPNPADGQFTVNFTAGTVGATTIALFDIAGKQLMNSEMNAQAAGTEVEINTENLAPGIYLVKISDENGATYVRVEIR